MGATESIVKQKLTNERDYQLFDEVKNSVKMICEPSINSSNEVNLINSNCKRLKIDQTNSGKSTCYMSALLDNLNKLSLDTQTKNDIIGDALAKGGIFPAESTVMQDVRNSEKFRLNKSTVNEALFQCAQKHIGPNIVNILRSTCEDVDIDQINSSLAECAQDSVQSNVSDTTVKSAYATRMEATAEAIGLDPTASFASSFAIVAVVIVIFLVIGGVSFKTMQSNPVLKYGMGICICILCLASSVVIGMWAGYEIDTKNDKK